MTDDPTQNGEAHILNKSFIKVALELQQILIGLSTDKYVYFY